MPACPTNEQLSEFLVGALSTEQLDALAEHIENCHRCQEIVDTLDDGANTVVARVRAEASIDESPLSLDCERMLEQAAVLLDIPISTGDTSALGRVRDYRLLGEGGMGAVYKALHINLKRVVALKVLPADRMRNQQAVSRFYREMEAVGKLHHPNIVHATDAGEDRGTHYLVMEHIEGIDLSELARRVGPLPIADACELVRQAAVGLQHAHEHGLVHRDIKPSNLMLTPGGQVKILDLGLARLSSAPDEHLTSTGQTMGTLDYMAPEQGGDSHEVDIRADIYSLGATLYKLLSGQAPFGDAKYNTPVKKLTALATAPIPSIRERRADLPDSLVELLERMLAKIPEDRLTPPSEVVRSLEPFTIGCDLSALMERALAGPMAEETVVAPTISTDQHLSSAMTGTRDDEPVIAIPETIDQSLPHAPHAELPSHNVDVEATVDLRPGSSPTGSSRRSVTATLQGSRRWLAGIVIGLLLLAGISAGVLFKIRTPDGTIWLTGDPAALEGAEVFVDDQYVMTIKAVDDPRAIKVSIDKMKGKLRVEKDGFLAFGREFDLSLRKDRQPITVRFDPAPNDSAVASESVPFDNWQPGPVDDVLPGLIPRPAAFAGIKRWQIETVAPRDTIEAIAYSLQGDMLACAGADRQTRVYDTASGQLKRLFVGGPVAKVSSLAWEPSGRVLASGEAMGNANGPAIKLWDIATGASIGELRGHVGDVNTLAWSPDGGTIASGSYDGTVRLWDFDRQVETTILGEMKLPIRMVAWSPDGSRLAAISHDKSIRIWDIASGETITSGTAEQPEWPIEDTPLIAWSPDGNKIASGGAGEFDIYDANDGTLLLHGGKRFTSGPYGLALAWMSEGGEIVVRAPGNCSWRTYSANDGHEISRHDAVTSSTTLLMAISEKGDQLAAAGASGEINLFSTVRNRHQDRIYAGTRYNSVFAISPNGERIVTPDGSQIRLHRTADGSLDELRSAPSRNGCYAFDWHPHGSLLACGGYEVLAVVDTQSGEVVRKPAPTTVAAVAWSPDGGRLAAHIGNEIHVWDELVELPIRVFDDHDAPVAGIAWSADGSKLAAVLNVRSGPGTAWCWNVETGELLWTHEEAKDGIANWFGAVAFTKDGKRVLLRGAVTRYVDAGTGRAGPYLKEIPRGFSLAFSPDDSKFVAGGYYNDFSLHDADSGKLLRQFRGHSRGIYTSVAFASDGRHIVSGNKSDGTLRWWDADTGHLVWMSLQLPDGKSAVFSEAGQLLTRDPDVKQHLIYIVENEDSSLDLLQPSEFEARIGQSLTVEPYDTPAQHRELAEFVLEHGGTIAIRLGEGEELIIEAGARLPSDEFTVFVVGGFAADHGVAPDDHGVFSAVGGLQKFYGNFLPLGDALIQSLRQSAPTLTQLHLMHSRITDDGLKQLEQFREIDYLNVSETTVSDEGLSSVAKLKRLQLVRLLRTKVTESGVAELSKALPSCRIEWDGGVIEPTARTDRRVAEWALSRKGTVGIRRADGSYFTADSVNQLPTEPFAVGGVMFNDAEVTDDELEILGQLQAPVLDVQFYGAPIDGSGLRHLTGRQLNWLSLDDTQVTDESLAPVLPNLEFTSLELEGTQIGDATVKLLKGREYLWVLKLAETNVTDAGLKYLNGIRIEHLRIQRSAITGTGFNVDNSQFSIGALDLNRSRLSDEGLRSIAEIEGLDFLDASITAITDQGLKHLATAGQLKELRLSANSITDGGLEHLASIKTLRRLNVLETKVTEVGVTELSKALPGCRIEWDGGVIEPTTSADRRAAEWVLRRGGKLSLVTRQGAGLAVTQLDDLPEDDFQLTAAYFSYLVSDLKDEELRILQEIDSLKYVSLNANAGLTGAVLDSLIASKETLEHLSLGGVQITDKGAARLAEFRHLTMLDLNGTQITDAGVEHISQMASLTSLYIYGTKITEAGLENLVRLPKLQLICTYGITTDRCVELLAGMKELEILDIGGPHLTDAGLVHLEQHPRLTKFNLHPSAQVTNEGLTSLAKIPMLKTLTIGTGVDTVISDAGVAHLAKLSALKYLYLDVPTITDSSLTELARLSNLTTLVIAHGKITEAGVTALSKALPNCRIEWDGGVIEPK